MDTVFSYKGGQHSYEFMHLIPPYWIFLCVTTLIWETDYTYFNKTSSILSCKPEHDLHQITPLIVTRITSGELGFYSLIL